MDCVQWLLSYIVQWQRTVALLKSVPGNANTIYYLYLLLTYRENGGERLLKSINMWQVVCTA